MIRWAPSRLRRGRGWERFRRERWDRSHDRRQTFLRRSFLLSFYSISRCRGLSRCRFRSLLRSRRGRVDRRPRETLRVSPYRRCRAGRVRSRDWWIGLLRSCLCFRLRLWAEPEVSRYPRERHGRCQFCQSLRDPSRQRAAAELCCWRMSRHFQSQWNFGCRSESPRLRSVAAGRCWKHSVKIRNIF